MLEQEWRSEKQAGAIRVENLEETVKRQTQEMAALKEALTTATAQSQTLAATVIESVSSKHARAQETATKE